MVDPFAHATAGVFSASGVRVRRRVGSHRTHSDRHALCTPRFCARRHGGVLDVEHDLRPEELSDELAVGNLELDPVDDLGRHAAIEHDRDDAVELSAGDERYLARRDGDGWRLRAPGNLLTLGVDDP